MLLDRTPGAPLLSGVRARCSPFSLASVAIVLLFAQPLAAQDLSDRLSELVEIGSAIALVADPDSGHSWYPDIWVGEPDAAIVLLVELDAEPWVLDVGLAVAQRGGAEADGSTAGASGGVALLAISPRRTDDDVAAAVASARIRAGGSGTPRAVVVLEGAPVTDVVVTSPGGVAPRWVAEALISGPPDQRTALYLFAARIGARADHPTVSALNRQNLTAIALRAPDGGALGQLAEQRVGRLLTTMETASERRERTYLVVPTPVPLILGEGAMVFGVLGTTALLLLYAITETRRVKRYLRAIMRGFPLLAVLFLAVLASQIGMNGAIRALIDRTTVRVAPIWLLYAKVAAAIIVLSLASVPLRTTRRRSTTAYSGAALAVFIVAAMVTGAFNLAIGSLLLIPVVATMLFSIAHRTWSKTLTLALAAIPAAYLVSLLVLLGDPTLAAIILTPPLAQEAVGSIIIFPLMLMFFRTVAITPRVPLVAMAASASTVLIAVVAAMAIVSTGSPDPLALVVQETHDAPAGTARVAVGPSDGDGTVVVLAAPLPLTFAGSDTATCDRLPCSRRVPLREAEGTIAFRSRAQLGRTALDWELSLPPGAQPPTITFAFAREVLIYQSNVPTAEAIGATTDGVTILPAPAAPADAAGTLVVQHPEGPGTVTALLTYETRGAGGNGPGVTIATHTVEWRIAAGGTAP